MNRGVLKLADTVGPKALLWVQYYMHAVVSATIPGTVTIVQCVWDGQTDRLWTHAIGSIIAYFAAIVLQSDK
jgi:hypothetical protein